MKALHFIFTVSVFLIFNSLALHASTEDITGRARLILWPGYGSTHTLEVRHEGNKILGHTYFGPNSMVSLEVGDGVYEGTAGGDGLTHLNCNERRCEGKIGGYPAYFKTFSVYDTQTHEPNLQIRGAINFEGFRIKKTPTKIEIVSNGNMKLSLIKDGVYEGSGFKNANPRSSFRARLKTSGTLHNLVHDPALLVILLVPGLAVN